MKSIFEYGKIMQDAFWAIVEQIEEERFGAYLDGEFYSEEEYERFKKEVEQENFISRGLIVGYSENKETLSNLTFMGGFPLAFQEGQKYEKQIEDIQKLYE